MSLCRCLREAALLCPRCAEPICSRCATTRPVCARCGETLLFDPDVFDSWLDAHLSDQLAARALENLA